jgi:hypothetical protein
MKDIKTTSFHRPIKFNHLSVFNSDVCFNKPIICDVYISGNLAVSGTTDISGSARIGSRGPTGGGLIVSGSPGLVPGESQEPIVALSGIELGPGHPPVSSSIILPGPSYGLPSASFFNTAQVVTSSGPWTLGVGVVVPNDNPTVVLNGYCGQIKFNDVTLGEIIAPPGSNHSFQIDLRNTAIADGDIVLTTCTENPHNIAASFRGSICTSVHSIEDHATNKGQCQINVSNVGAGFANQALTISFLIIGQTPGGPFGPGPH